MALTLPYGGESKAETSDSLVMTQRELAARFPVPGRLGICEFVSSLLLGVRLV